jgi:hypothetical protein
MGWEIKYASHLPVLIRALQATTGPVLELGTGQGSTPVLHWLCLPTKRELVSYENSGKFERAVKQYRTDWHQIRYVKKWDQAQIERPWSVALVDHGPPLRRRVEIRRLAQHAQLILIHDTDWYHEREYRLNSVLPSFRFNWEFNLVRPRTRVVSNFVDPAEIFQW